MALINCPECGRQVSSQAATCPGCGVALAGVSRAPGGLQPGGVGGGSVPLGPEQTVWEATPSLLLLLGQVVRVALVVVAAIVLLAVVIPGVLGAMGDVGRTTWVNPAQAPLLLGLVIGGYLLFRAVRIGLLAARLKTTRYRASNQRITVESGLLSRSNAEVDLRSVDDLVFEQGPVERLLGIGTVTVVSSDKTAPRLRLRGVKDPKATRELIRTHVYAATQRQLFTRST
jgi:membrane protein YdbS with pleckstrin-like domain